MELEDPRFWVLVAFIGVMIGLWYKKVPGMVLSKLDERSAKIKAELETARRLREEAEMLLAQYTQKQAEYLKEAESILTDARKDAERLSIHAGQELKVSLDARTKQAMERIAQEESKAVADVRNHVVDIALAAARNLIVEHIETMSQEELIKLALSDIERKVH